MEKGWLLTTNVYASLTPFELGFGDGLRVSLLPVNDRTTEAYNWLREEYVTLILKLRMKNWPVRCFHSVAVLSESYWVYLTHVMMVSCVQCHR
jgi:hypothetical protein